MSAEGLPSASWSSNVFIAHLPFDGTGALSGDTLQGPRGSCWYSPVRERAGVILTGENWGDAVQFHPLLSTYLGLHLESPIGLHVTRAVASTALPHRLGGVDRPEISVIIPSLTDDNFLRETLVSVVCQAGVKIQAVVVCADRVPDALPRQRGADIGWIRAEPRGIFQAMNTGLAHASGKWVAFLGAGDTFYHSATCARLLRLERSNTRRGPIEVIFGRAEFVGPNGSSFRKYGRGSPKLAYHWGMPFPHIGTLFRRNLFEQFGGFDESFLVASDFEWISRVICEGRHMQSSGLVSVRVRQGGVSNGSASRRIAIREESRVLQIYRREASTFGVIVRSLKILYNLLRLRRLFSARGAN